MAQRWVLATAELDGLARGVVPLAGAHGLLQVHSRTDG